MKLQNVLQRLKEIAKDNDSEDIARAIETTSAYSFKDRLAEMEGFQETRDGFDKDGNDVGTETDGPDRDEDENQFSTSDVESASVYDTPTTSVDETPGDDDQYCANCGNTGYSLATTGEECPQCGPGEGGEADNKDEAWNRIADRVDAREGMDDDAELAQMGKNAGIEETGDDEDIAYDAQPGDDEPMGSALDRVIDRCKRSGDGGPVDRVVARVASRNSDGLGDDPWGIGEGGEEDLGVPDDIQMGQEEGPRDRIHDRVEARGGVGGGDIGVGEGEDMGFDADTDDESEDMGFDASTDDTDGEDSYQSRDTEAAYGPRDDGLEEDIPMSFNNSMDRHSWLMQQLSQAASQMDPKSAQVIKSIIQKAGEANVGGNA